MAPKFGVLSQDCIGALDGTHVRVKVSNEDAPRYQGWEGTASDSRIIKSALTRNDNLKIPQGKYYFVDAGYINRSCLIAPYSGVHYHLKEYSVRPQNAKEVFNLQHASLRTAIERGFGVLKKRFPIIATTTEPNYCVDTQNEIILACCILHNYLMGVDPDESLIAEVDEEVLHSHRECVALNPREDDEDARQGDIIRDSIASAMWQNYVQM
nr:putative nuclease HARBI1 [Quercus suber]